MKKAKKLKAGDTVAVVSLSSGMLGDNCIKDRYKIAKNRIEQEYGLVVKEMSNCLKGSEVLYNHPELRAQDLMAAFKDKEVKAIICAIGGNDTIRMLPYINFSVLRKNPKIFMGYSDTTVNHFMLNKAKICSLYGPSILGEFAENIKMHEYTDKYINDILFLNKEKIEIVSSNVWTSEFLDWSVTENNLIQRKMKSEKHGFEILQGNENVTGKLLGGCIDVFPMIMGTKIWPSKKKWKNKILFFETSEDCPAPYYLEYILRNMGVQGILSAVNGIIVGKPSNEKYYDEYKKSILKIVKDEFNIDIPIIYNVNFGHTAPMCIMPYNVSVTIDLKDKKIVINEKVLRD